MAKQLGIKGKLNVVATIELVLKIALTALFAVFTVVMIIACALASLGKDQPGNDYAKAEFFMYLFMAITLYVGAGGLTTSIITYVKIKKFKEKKQLRAIAICDILCLNVIIGIAMLALKEDVLKVEQASEELIAKE